MTDGKLAIQQYDYENLEALRQAELEAGRRLKEAIVWWEQNRTPIRVGDIVEVNDYSFRGHKMKVRGARFLLNHTSGSASGPALSVTGYILKGDGTPGLRVGHSIFPLEIQP